MNATEWFLTFTIIVVCGFFTYSYIHLNKPTLQSCESSISSSEEELAREMHMWYRLGGGSRVSVITTPSQPAIMTLRCVAGHDGIAVCTDAGYQELR